MILNPFKLDDASRVYERGKRLGLSTEEMLRALEVYASLKKFDEPENVVSLIEYARTKNLSPASLVDAVNVYSCTEPGLLRALCKIPLREVMSVIIAPRKRKIIVTHPHPLDGHTNRPIHHRSGKGVISYQSYLYY